MSPGPEAFSAASEAHGLSLFDYHDSGTSTLFFLAQGTRRYTIALVNGDDLLDRFAKMLTILQGDAEMAKEIGMPKGASKKARMVDEKMDKAKGLKEGSPADLKADKAIAKKYPAKRGK